MPPKKRSAKKNISKSKSTVGKKPPATNSPSKTGKKPERKSMTQLRTVNPSGKSEDNFFELVYQVAVQIPKGRVTSYGAIANALGTKMSARMVGWAMNACSRSDLKVPAHRVVNRNGMLSGKFHFSTPSAMETLLKKEGVAVKDNQVVNFEKHFWDP